MSMKGRGRIAGLAALVLASCGLGGSVSHVGPRTYLIECRDTADCYWDANNVCPYGYRTGGAQTVTDGATVNKLGNTVLVQTKRHGELLVTCQAPVFCAQQRDCSAMDMRCVRSKRYPGQNVCANR